MRTDTAVTRIRCAESSMPALGLHLIFGLPASYIQQDINVRVSRVVLVLVTLLVAACGRSSDQCAPIVAQDARQFADSSMELLAATLSPGVAADEKVYDRLVGDIQAIKLQHPETSDIEYSGPHDGRTLLIELGTFETVLRSLGLYHHWDCLNNRYQTDAISAEGHRLQIRFKNIYDLKRVAPFYEELPGVKWASPNARLVMDGRKTICVVPQEDGWQYFLEKTGSGTRNKLHYFRTEVNGRISEADSWSIPDSAADATKKPAWVDEYWATSSCKQ